MLFFLSSCRVPDGVPVLGENTQGNPQQIMVPEGEYSKSLQTIVRQFKDSTLPVLVAREEKNNFSLRTFALGIGVNAEVGVGAFKVGAFPKVRLIFSNSTKPTAP